MPEPALLAALRDIVPKGAGCGWADPRQDSGLFAGEKLPGAVPSRLYEFSAGRAAARAAMAEIELAPSAIPHAPSREPIWPAGVMGSITHTATACLAVVLPVGHYRGIGIDLEPQGALGPDLWRSILHPTEWERLASTPQCHQAKLAQAYFCAKEAAYKAQYPVSREILEFHDFIITFQQGNFEARFQRDVGSFADQSVINGRTKAVDGHLLALAIC